jgi:Na+-transporting NADH:ubiquinone oxidoreductase subunit C
LLLTIIVSSLLSITSTNLASIQKNNKDIDQKRNILESIGLNISKLNSENIIEEYNNRIRNVVLDINGNIVDDIKFNLLNAHEDKRTGEINYFIDQNEYLPAYQSLNPPAFIIPISGKGLWSTLYGYFALANDYNTVKGITFYEHGETAGLGGEIEKKWFRDNFIGKKIYNDKGELVSIIVVKGKASDKLDEDLIHGVDGISGATITSKGVTALLKRDLNRYKIFMDKNRRN